MLPARRALSKLEAESVECLSRLPPLVWRRRHWRDAVIVDTSQNFKTLLTTQKISRHHLNCNIIEEDEGPENQCSVSSYGISTDLALRNRIMMDSI